MAYTFSKTQSLFNQPEQKVDIFGQPQQDQQAGGSGGSSSPGGAKTSTEGTIGGGASGATSSGESANPTDIITPAAAAMKSNIGKANGPSAVQKAQTDIGAAEQGFQNEANQYVQNYANQDYGLSQDDLSKAESGDKEAFSKTLSRVRNQAAPTVNAFKQNTDTNIEDIQTLGTDAGLKSLLRRDAGDQYNAGEGAFDTGLLRRNTNFNLTLDALRRQQEALSQKSAEYQITKTPEAQKAAQAAYDAATGKIKETLGKDSESVKTSAAAKAKQLADERSGQIANKPKYIEDQAKAARDELLAAQTDGNLRDIYSQDLSPTKAYYSDPNDNETYQARPDLEGYYSQPGEVGSEYYDAPVADKFNRIQDLLGTGQKVAASDPAAQQSFNKAKYQDDINSKAQGQYKERIQGSESTLNRISGIMDKVFKANKLSDLSKDERGTLPDPNSDILGQVHAAAKYLGRQVDPSLEKKVREYAAQYEKLKGMKNSPSKAAPAPVLPTPNYNPIPSSGSQVSWNKPVANPYAKNTVPNPYFKDEKQ